MHTLPLKRTDEIGVLARCFDHLRREIKAQMDVLHNKQRELAHLASHDGLTGLPNRMLFMQRLESAIQEAKLRDQGLAVLFVDLDRFKQINDQFGHSVGDNVLVAVAGRLKEVLCSVDVVARLGGDEFIVLIEGARAEDAAPGIASRIMDTLNETLMVNGHAMTVGASIGISQFPDDSGTAEELLLHADAAMYAAKSGGRCGYLRYQDLLETRRRRKQAEQIEQVEQQIRAEHIDAERARAGESAIQGREAEPMA
jgi:diguanylate cyclase (GGDEF)-like protein